MLSHFVNGSRIALLRTKDVDCSCFKLLKGHRFEHLNICLRFLAAGCRCVSVCVCVCERERERMVKRRKKGGVKVYHILHSGTSKIY